MNKHMKLFYRHSQAPKGTGYLSSGPHGRETVSGKRRILEHIPSKFIDNNMAKQINEKKDDIQFSNI